MSRAWAAAVALTLFAAGCARELQRAPDGVLVLSIERTSSWVRNFNPVTPAATPRWPTWAGVYEPLLVFNSLKSEYVPWLATSTQWLDDNRTLRLVLREGVLWSDGESFDAADVVFTFELLRDHPATDQDGMWQYLSSVHATGSHEVLFGFSRVFVPGYEDIVAQQIVPEHIWRDVDDPVAFANENPVATGPFTEVRVFRNQIYEIGRNPHYWQEGKPAVEALRFPAYSGNDRSNMALVFGEVDWAGDFLPAIDRVFVDRDPQHHQYWFPLTGSGIFLYANTRRQPFDDVNVRKAMSMAIDRQLLVDVAMFRYTRPADATGLSDAYTAWRDSSAVRRGAEWVTHDVDSANALLDAAGFERGSDGWRRDAGGDVLRFDVLCVSGWSDWVRAVQVIARGLQEVGIDARVRTFDFGAWFQQMQSGDFDLSIGWSYEGATPYRFYRWLMSSDTVQPEGATTLGNWHRYASAAADSVLREFETVSDPVRQRELSSRMQHIFVTEAPAIPLFPGPSWAEYNTSRFVGFPSPENPYADPSPNKFDRGEVLLVLTNLQPRNGR